MVNDKGDLVTYNEATNGKDFMKAVTTNLGLFGFVYKMTMNVEPKEYIVQTTNVYHTVKNTLSDPTQLKVGIKSKGTTFSVHNCALGFCRGTLVYGDILVSVQQLGSHQTSP